MSAHAMPAARRRVSFLLPPPHSDRSSLPLRRDPRRGTHFARFVLEQQVASVQRVHKNRAALVAANRAPWAASLAASRAAAPASLFQAPGAPLSVVASALPAVADPRAQRERDVLGHVITVDGFLSAAECTALVASAEAATFVSKAELRRLSPIAPRRRRDAPEHTYRIMLVEDPALARVMWARMRHVVLDYAAEWPLVVFPDAPVLRMRPVGVCPLMRIVRYIPGQEFPPHADGKDSLSAFEGRPGIFKSAVTLVVYLSPSVESGEGSAANPGSAGGVLEFLRPPRLRRAGPVPLAANITCMERVFDSYSPPIRVTPKLGRAVLFGQNEFHAAGCVTAGVKYAVQTSIMYEISELDA